MIGTKEISAGKKKGSGEGNGEGVETPQTLLYAYMTLPKNYPLKDLRLRKMAGLKGLACSPYSRPTQRVQVEL